MEKDKLLEMLVSDAITEKPIEFMVKDRKFSIKPPTIGKLEVLSKIYLSMDINEYQLEEFPHLEAMRLCRDKADSVCRLMAVATLDTKEELNDEEMIKERADFFKWSSTTEAFSTVLLALLVQCQYENFINSIRLTEILRLNRPTGKSRADRVE